VQEGGFKMFQLYAGGKVPPVVWQMHMPAPMNKLLLWLGGNSAESAAGRAVLNRGAWRVWFALCEQDASECRNRSHMLTQDATLEETNQTAGGASPIAEASIFRCALPSDADSELRKRMMAVYNVWKKVAGGNRMGNYPYVATSCFKRMHQDLEKERATKGQSPPRRLVTGLPHTC